MKPYAVGIDVGGTKIAAGVLDRSMKILSVHVTKEHAGQLPAQVVHSIEKAYWETLKQAQVSASDVAGIGLSFAGHTDGRRGVVLTSSNMPEWDQVPLRDILVKRLNQRVLIDNDTNLAVVAEHRWGAAHGASDVVYITFSTGVGMGILVNGKLYQGYTGTAGEIGHTVVEIDGRRCSCGKRGCIMAYAGGLALRALAWERIQSNEETALRDLSWDDPKLIDGELICEVAMRGDPVAQDLIISSGRYLGIALSTIVQVLNPELIVIGGGLTNMGSMLLDPCLESLRQNVHPVLWGAGRIVLGRFQQNVSIIGGAAAVFSEMESDVPETVSDFAAVALDRTAPTRTATILSSAERSTLERVEGNVFDVQRYSLDDGPGLRTAVFLKGCPLRCAWCANPESQRVIPELLLFPSSCVACGACVDICSSDSRKLDGDHIFWDRKSCTRCGDCAGICPAHATVWSGNRRAAGDVLREALADTAFYEDGGGLTLTGGEPLLQPIFAEAMLRLAKADGLNTAIETTGNAPWETLETVSPYVDLWLFDLKHMDSPAHRKWTGLGNELILSNLRRLAASGAPIRVRMPLVSEVNASEDNLRRTGEFLAQLGGSVQSLDLLQYHKLARAKYEALGQTAKFYDGGLMPDTQVEAAAKLLRSYKLTVHIVGRATRKELQCLPQ
jgi:glycyl-radical enzyme activating protein/glucokinase-like ROK family protein